MRHLVETSPAYIVFPTLRDKQLSSKTYALGSIFGLLISFLVIVASIGLIHESCPFVSKQWQTLGWFSVGVAIMAMLLHFLFLIRFNWAWKTSSFRDSKPVGEDIEDIEPYYLSHDGHRILSRTLDSGFKMENEEWQANNKLDQSLKRVRQLEEL